MLQLIKESIINLKKAVDCKKKLHSSHFKWLTTRLSLWATDQKVRGLNPQCVPTAGPLSKALNP